MSSLNDWNKLDKDEKLEYLIERGKSLPTLENKSDDMLVNGCQSKVWVNVEIVNNEIKLQLDSNSVMVKGILSLLYYKFNGKKINELDEVSIESIIDEFDLDGLISIFRIEGIKATINKIKQLSKK